MFRSIIVKYENADAIPGDDHLYNYIQPIPPPDEYEVPVTGKIIFFLLFK